MTAADYGRTLRRRSYPGRRRHPTTRDLLKPEAGAVPGKPWDSKFISPNLAALVARNRRQAVALGWAAVESGVSRRGLAYEEPWPR